MDFHPLWSVHPSSMAHSIQPLKQEGSVASWPERGGSLSSRPSSLCLEKTDGFPSPVHHDLFTRVLWPKSISTVVKRFGFEFFDKRTFGQMTFRANDFRVSELSGKWSFGQTIFGKMTIRANDLSGKWTFGQTSLWQMAFGQMIFGLMTRPR